MRELESKELKKLYYTIGEVAAFFNVNPSLIRFWEKEFGFRVSKKNKKGNRLFSVKDIQNFNKIYQLVKVEGYTLDGARKVLSEKKKPLDSSENKSKEELIDRLEKIKARLIQLKS
ncbi:MAG: MerR family transcriptional regulator [Bacteroidetes bacterium]|nr:MAG: MerR family transcriptional regulator [Bacteroidota bacterium]